MSTLKTKAQSILDEKDSKIIPENIKKDVTIFDVTGTMEEGIDTSDATATFDDIIEGKTAYIDGQKVMGTLQIAGSGPVYVDVEYVGDNNPDIDVTMYLRTNNKEVLDNDTQIEAEISYVDLAKAIDLTSDKIASGESVLGMEGTYEGLDTSDATATASDILSGKTAYVNGDKITGTLEISDNSIMKLSNGRELLFNCTNLASILSSKLSSAQKELQLFSESSWNNPALVLSCAYALDDNYTEPHYIGLSISREDTTLTLVDISPDKRKYIIGTLNTGDSDVEDYYQTVMSVQDFIDLLNAIGEVNVTLDTTSILSSSHTLYAYSPVTLILNTEEYAGTAPTPIHLSNVTNNFMEDVSTVVSEIIQANDRVNFDFTTLAQIIDDNTDASEKTEYLNEASSSDDPLMVLSTGVYTYGSEEPSPDTRLCLQNMNGGGGISLVCIEADGTVEGISSDHLISESSCIEIPTHITVQELIDLFRYVEDGSIICDLFTDGPTTFEFETPVTEITLKGPNIDKTILVPSGTTFMEVINA